MLTLLFALHACTPEPEETGDPPPPSGPLAVDNLEVLECQSGDPAAATPTLTATDMGGGSVLVVHEGHLDECCLSFDVTASVDGAAVQVEYPPVGEPCDCLCAYDLSYRLGALPRGDYTIDAGAESTAVSVD